MNAATRQPAQRTTTIEADPQLPTITLTREFDHPVEKVFRAHTDRDLFVQWIGPRGIDSRIDHWDCRTGGSYRYTHSHDDFVGTFFGSFHEVRDDERIVQTFTWDGAPDGVSLETLTFEALDGGRCRLVGMSIVDSMEVRDLILSSGMDVGVNEGYAKLDELLARG